MTDNSVDTKEKILQAARVLFAEKGFEGTSVRDIAKLAEVNVASVNYHFNNKENLFSEIMVRGHAECSQEIRKFYEENNPGVEEMLVHVFHYFLEKSPELKSHFKMMMSAEHVEKIPCGNQGPPGGEVIVEVIQKELGFGIPEKDLHWAIKTLFSQVVHLSLMYHCLFKRSTMPFTTASDLEENIRRLSKVVVQELKSSKEGK